MTNSHNYMQKSKETRRVRFYDCAVVIEFQPIVDPKLKHELYYSVDELYTIRKLFELEITLRRQVMRARALDQALRAKKANFVVSGNKRPLINVETPGTVMSNKRRRKHVPAE